MNWSTTYQTIDGFGASSAGDVNTVSPGLMDFFYSTTNSGIGLDFMRLKIYPSLADCEGDEGSGNCVKVDAGPTLSVWDLANAQAAVARGAKVVAGEWSPPGPMKSTGSYQGGGSLNGNSANYTRLASIQAAFVELMSDTYHIPIYALSPQNEPDVNQPYPSCNWTGQQFHDYVPYLAEALAKAGYGSVKIMISESGTWTNVYDSAAMNDSTVAADVGILAEHGYNSVASQLKWKNLTNQHVWETEVSDFNSYDGSINSALIYATEIHDWLNLAGVNAWFWWALEDDQGEGHNCCLTDASNNIAVRAYAIGNWSKFVRPGWRRIGVTNGGSLLVTAFKGPGNQFAIVAVNKASWSVRNQMFTLNGITSQRSRVTPWLTSATALLAPQPPVSVASNGTMFTYSVPAKSVVTFQGQAD
jgi:glucuronoarabinoxylan endo-1,4-beta-xylanase